MAKELERILVVDDSELNRCIISELFEKKYDIVEASCGDEAIEILHAQRNELSIVFLDIVMPGKSGLDVLQYMDNRGYLETLPVIIITGDVTTENMDRAFAYGAADVIAKPFDGKILLKRTSNIIELYKTRCSLERKVRILAQDLAEKREEMEKRLEILARECDESYERNHFLFNLLEQVNEGTMTPQDAYDIAKEAQENN